MKKIAQITNPVLPNSEGGYTGVANNPLAPLFVRLWRTVVVVGGVSLLLYFVWGAVDWLMSEGKPDKLEAAKNKITHAFIGMALLAASFAIMILAEAIFGFDILNIVWPTP